jgi:hypothetical protein
MYVLYQGTIWLSYYPLHVHMGRWKTAFTISKGEYRKHLNNRFCFTHVKLSNHCYYFKHMKVILVAYTKFF